MKIEQNDVNEYFFSRDSNVDFDSATDMVRKGLAKEGFGIISEIRFDTKLKEKLGVEFRRYVIFGACDPSLAYSALQEDLNIGLLLPCNVIVYEKGASSFVAAVDAIKMLSIAGMPELEKTAEKVNEKLRRVLDEHL